MRSANLTVAQKGILLVSIPVAIELFFVAILLVLLHVAERDSDRIENSRDILLGMLELQSVIARGMSEITFDEQRPATEFKTIFERFDREFSDSAARVRQKVAKRKDLAEIGKMGDEMTQKTSILISRARDVYMDPSIDPIKRGFYLRNDFNETLLRLGPFSKKFYEIDGKIRAQAPRQVVRNIVLLIAGITAGVCFSLIASFFLGSMFSRDIVSRLGKIRENLRCLVNSKPLPHVLEGKDEIAFLDEELHRSANILEDTRKRENAILYNAADVLVSISPDLTIKAIGKSCEKLWGYSSSDLIGKSIETLLSSDDLQNLKACIRGEHLTAGSPSELETFINRRNGNPCRSLWSLNQSGDDGTFYCVIHDISQRYELEKMKQRLISIASHDLRSPLTAVSTALNVINRQSEGSLPREASKEISRAESAVERLMDLISDLLDLEKLEAGKFVGNIACVSAMDLCMAAKQELEPLVARRGMKITGPEQDASIAGDERRLLQVLMNLLSNAIKYSPDGSVVELSVSELDNYVEIAVRDFGQGIPPSDLPFVFERFYQSTPSQTVNVKSTGLGLAIVRSIVAAHGGQAGVESEPGKGSRFWFRIPAFRDNQEEHY